MQSLFNHIINKTLSVDCSRAKRLVCRSTSLDCPKENLVTKNDADGARGGSPTHKCVV